MSLKLRYTIQCIAEFDADDPAEVVHLLDVCAECGEAQVINVEVVKEVNNDNKE